MVYFFYKIIRGFWNLWSEFNALYKHLKTLREKINDEKKTEPDTDEKKSTATRRGQSICFKKKNKIKFYFKKKQFFIFYMK